MRNLLALLIITTAFSLERGLTTHFKEWLASSSYSSYAFERSDIAGGAYGGKEGDDQTLAHNPIIFVHGNSDIAVGLAPYVEWQTGFTSSIDHFLSKGYTKAELYITTWGEGNPMMAAMNSHGKETVMYTRKFIEAVMEYTGAKKIDIISHSMGVTLARGAIKGISLPDDDGTQYEVGSYLGDKIDVFISLGGANYGLHSCEWVSSLQTCNEITGFFPGSGLGPSDYLKALNDETKEGGKIFAAFATNDHITSGDVGGVIYGEQTGTFPTVDEHREFEDPDYSHFEMRDRTLELQHECITNKKMPSYLLPPFLQ